MALENGSIIDGKYKILNEIGHGGMSIVYLAMNEKANKPWAIKEVRKDGVKDFEIVKQGLVVETDLLKRLDHPNLPSIVDVIDDEGRFLIVMDYIEGNPLSQKLEEKGAQPQDEVVRWGIQLCDVLGYLHTRTPAIIYRDMKPANVMLKPDGQVTVIDFGTAREFKERNLADTICLGTIGYAAPEQYGGRGQTDARTDIYCLGATLYHLVTGKTPNPTEPPYYGMVPIREINPNLSTGLEEIILKCTMQLPSQRYQSCAELMYDLEHYKEREVVYKKRQKHKLAAFIAVTALALVSAGVGITGGQLKKREENNNYTKLLEDADRATDVQEKADFCKQALEIRPEGREAMEKLIDAYREDSQFTVEEDNDFRTTWEKCNAALKTNRKDYRDICFEVGKMYWFDYAYGINENTMDNSTVRMKSARTWFNEVLQYSDDSYDDRSMAKVYASIGDFYAEIDTAQKEGEDEGLYRDYWKDLSSLVELVEAKEDEREPVKLQLCQQVANSISSYARKFKTDGVSREEQDEMIKQAEAILADIDTNSSDVWKSLKEQIQDSLTEAKKQIDVAYPEEKEAQKL